MERIKILLNDVDSEGKRIGRKEVEAELIKRNATTLVVKLADGNIITRKISRDLVK